MTFSDIQGYRFQAFATDTAIGQLAHLEARHRAHARVEDRIRCAKDTGLGRFPSRQFNVNAAWLELCLLACDLIAWTVSRVKKLAGFRSIGMSGRSGWPGPGARPWAGSRPAPRAA